MSSKYLYLIATKYPFQGGEPFLEEELKFLSNSFEKIHLIVPEGHRINDRTIKFSLPPNCELHVFGTVPSVLDKLFGITSIISDKFKKEKYYISNIFKQQFSLFHLKTWIGFMSLAKCFQRQLKLIVKENDYPEDEVSIYSYWFFYSTAGIAMLKEEMPKLNCITRIHGWDCFFDRAQGDYLPARPWVTSVIDGVYSISKAGLEHTRTKLPKASNLHLSYLGIKEVEFNLMTDQNHDILHLVSIAFIDPIKQLSRIVDALYLIDDLKVKWTHIGGALDGDLSLVDYSKTKLHNKSNIEVDFKGSLTQKEVYDFLMKENADALICTSRSEGLPVSMMEALAHAIPIISVDVGGISEIVQNDFNGILVPSDSSDDDIARVIVSFSNFTNEKRQQLRKNALLVYHKKFKSSVNYPKFINQAFEKPKKM